MGWKWNNYRAKLQMIGLTEQQIDAVEAIATAKKWELVDILEQQVANSSTGTNAFARGREHAFREVITGVKPHGPRKTGGEA